MKRNEFYLIVGLMVGAMIAVVWGSAFAAIKVLSIDGEQSVQSSYYGDTYNYTCINEEVPSGSDYIYVQNGGSSTDYYWLEDSTTDLGTIDMVMIRYNVFRTGSNNGSINVGLYFSDNTNNLPASPTPVCFSNGTWLYTMINPNFKTAAAWEWADFEDLRIRVDLTAGSSSSTRVNSVQVWVFYSTGEECPECPECPETGGVQVVPAFLNDWTGEYTTDFETYYEGSQVEVFGQRVFMSKQNFIFMTSLFGAIIAGIIMFVLFKAVL